MWLKTSSGRAIVNSDHLGLLMVVPKENEWEVVSRFNAGQASLFMGTKEACYVFIDDTYHRLNAEDSVASELLRMTQVLARIADAVGRQADYMALSAGYGYDGEPNDPPDEIPHTSWDSDEIPEVSWENDETGIFGL